MTSHLLLNLSTNPEKVSFNHCINSGYIQNPLRYSRAQKIAAISFDKLLYLSMFLNKSIFNHHPQLADLVQSSGCSEVLVATCEFKKSPQQRYSYIIAYFLNRKREFYLNRTLLWKLTKLVNDFNVK